MLCNNSIVSDFELFFVICKVIYVLPHLVYKEGITLISIIYYIIHLYTILFLQLLVKKQVKK